MSQMTSTAIPACISIKRGRREIQTRATPGHQLPRGRPPMAVLHKSDSPFEATRLEHIAIGPPLLTGSVATSLAEHKAAFQLQNLIKPYMRTALLDRRAVLAPVGELVALH